MRFAPAALRFFRRSSAQAIEQDPAEMGTAFGMEASLEPIEDFRPSVREYGLESQQLGTASGAAESPLAWLSRRS